ncbi:type III PLP-dependent enzyme [Streptomyces beihaiensis]|uniref:ornithine decarboxylase n=1 Tax=Streptomyces beihaiensis TaxID=2984495 RepID=A0ABT3TP40_9ACTN|nr:type III PLP-dependent enzyme [Streptomyces beihaiensis]MCX3058803.1 type III PLP-dependent enzyme [Streptomyces beihaiensis]
MSARTAAPPLRAALAAATEDRLVYDLAGIAGQYDMLRRELPGVRVRFALKACPVDDVLTHLAGLGAGVDAASPQEIEQALRAGVPLDRIHYGNTVKSDRAIAHARRLGVRDYATDNAEDVAALAAHAPGARVFCRLATSGRGALWGLSEKFGCPTQDAVDVLTAARAAGLVPAGLSVHVGSQQMTAGAWREAFDDLGAALAALRRRGIVLDHVNLGGGLPALGYADRHGSPLDPPLDKIFAVVREGMARLRAAHGAPLAFVMEPGRHLVADHGAIRAHVVRLARRRAADGHHRYWLYLSCGRFNGLYETDALRHPLVFPGHHDAEHVPAVVAGPTCDSDDTFAYHAETGEDRGLVRVPKRLSSGDPVWVLNTGAYAVSYMTQGFNGFAPLPLHCVGGGAVTAAAS